MTLQQAADRLNQLLANDTDPKTECCFSYAMQHGFADIDRIEEREVGGEAVVMFAEDE